MFSKSRKSSALKCALSQGQLQQTHVAAACKHSDSSAGLKGTAWQRHFSGAGGEGSQRRCNRSHSLAAAIMGRIHASEAELSDTGSQLRSGEGFSKASVRKNVQRSIRILSQKLSHMHVCGESFMCFADLLRI